MAAAIADVEALERQLTPAVLLPRFSRDITAAPLLILDANLSAAAIKVLHCTHRAAVRPSLEASCCWLDIPLAPLCWHPLAEGRNAAGASPGRVCWGSHDIVDALDAPAVVSCRQSARQLQMQVYWYGSSRSQVQSPQGTVLFYTQAHEFFR